MKLIENSVTSTVPNIQKDPNAFKNIPKSSSRTELSKKKYIILSVSLDLCI